MKNNFELEDFVKKNYDLFNSEVPKEGHLDRFKSKLEGQKKRKSLFLESLKYAAVIIVLVSMFFIYDNYSETSGTQVVADFNNDGDEDFTEIASFYDSQLEDKYSEFDAIVCQSGNSQKQTINEDLNELNNTYFELQNEYKMNPGNEMVKNALIDNYRMRIDILDLIINTLHNYC